MESLMEDLRMVRDPRVVGRTSHRLEDIIVTTVWGVMAGCESWVVIETWAETHEAWLPAVLGLELKMGIASHDTDGRMFAILDPQAMQSAFQEWLGSLEPGSRSGGVAIDRKALNK